jgi:hypothetical protein
MQRFIGSLSIGNPYRFGHTLIVVGGYTVFHCIAVVRHQTVLLTNIANTPEGLMAWRRYGNGWYDGKDNLWRSFANIFCISSFLKSAAAIG